MVDASPLQRAVKAAEERSFDSSVVDSFREQSAVIRSALGSALVETVNIGTSRGQAGSRQTPLEQLAIGVAIDSRYKPKRVVLATG